MHGQALVYYKSVFYYTIYENGVIWVYESILHNSGHSVKKYCWCEFRLPATYSHTFVIANFRPQTFSFGSNSMLICLI